MTQVTNTIEQVAIYNANATQQLVDIKVINSLKVKCYKMSKGNKKSTLLQTIISLCQAYKNNYGIDVIPA